MQSDKVTPIIMAGGTGTRLWPSSREAMPKQFCQIDGKFSLFQKTCRLTSNSALFNDPVVVTNAKYETIVRQQLNAVGHKSCCIVLEPVGRDTATAVALGAALPNLDSKQVCLAMPADHFFGRPEKFIEAVQLARAAVHDGRIVTFGVKPSSPETGYGYIKSSKNACETGHASIDRFIEKPTKDKAEKLIRDPNVLWNSGLFLFEKSIAEQEFQKYAPSILDKAHKSIQNGREDNGAIHPCLEILETIQSISFDYAIMEKTERAAVVPMDSKWSDVGSWKALWEISEKNERKNSVSGEVFLSNVSNSLVRTSGPTVGVVGLSDISVVVEDDAILVAHKKHCQDVKKIVQQMGSEGVASAKSHSSEQRPWGRFGSLDKGDNHHVKKIQVDCGGRLSLQYHHHRSEHWIIVRGTATVTVDGQVKNLGVGERVFIPQGATHRLENLSHEPVEIIEIQVGDYFGEDDIVRLEDIYGRNDEPRSNIDAPAAA